jgi:mycothiol system anti-sigma-R factor
MDDVEGSQMDDPCREALHRIYHFLDGELTPDVRQQIQVHLDDCPPCIGAFEFEAELRRVVARGCQEAVPEELRVRIALLIAHEDEQRFL